MNLSRELYVRAIRLGRACLITAGIGLVASVESNAQRMFFEDFESVPLGKNVEEARAGTKVWGKTPPAGWVADDSKMPGFGVSTTDGVVEWAGWSFANK